MTRPWGFQILPFGVHETCFWEINSHFFRRPHAAFPFSCIMRKHRSRLATEKEEGGRKRDEPEGRTRAVLGHIFLKIWILRFWHLPIKLDPLTPNMGLLSWFEASGSRRNHFKFVLRQAGPLALGCKTSEDKFEMLPTDFRRPKSKI